MDNAEYKTDSFYSIAEVAKHLKISQKSVRRYIASGELRAIKVGGAYRIPIDALEAFLNAGNEPTTTQYDLFGKEILISDKSEKIQSEEGVHWIDIREDWDMPSNSSMTFVDLFCGAGGLSKGLEQAGLNGVCGLDWFEEAGRTYRRNFHHPFVNGDITLPEKKQEFYDVVKSELNGRRLNIVAGGFLCLAIV